MSDEMGTTTTVLTESKMAWIRRHAGYQGDECLIWPFCRVRGYPVLRHETKPLKGHRVMCELVNGPAPSLRHQAAHSWGRGHDGCITPRHLSWKTKSENFQDKRKHGTHSAVGRKLTRSQAEQIRRLIPSASKTEIARRFNVSRATVRQIERGAAWRVR